MFGRLKLRNWTGCIAEVEQHFSLILIHNVCRGWKSWRWICVLLVTSCQCLTWQDYAVPGKIMLYLASSCCFLVFLYFRTICLPPYTNKLKQLKRYSSYSPQSIIDRQWKTKRLLIMARTLHGRSQLPLFWSRWTWKLNIRCDYNLFNCYKRCGAQFDLWYRSPIFGFAFIYFKRICFI